MSGTDVDRRNLEVAARVRGRSDTVRRTVILQLKDVAWYAALPAEERSMLGEVIGRATTGFADWLVSARRDPIGRYVFADVPPRMAAIIGLDQTVELVELMTAVGEETAAELGGIEHEDWLRREMMRFARDVALALAGIYARAAEWRGSVDARIEAHLLNLVISSGPEDEILSACAALNWNHQSGATAVVGVLRSVSDDVPAIVTRNLRHLKVTGLAGLHGNRAIALIAENDRARDVAEALSGLCDGSVVIGSTSGTLLAAGSSVKEALAGADAAPMLANCPRIVLAADLLPERALIGDELAHSTLVTTVFEPLRLAGEHIVETASAYLEAGASLQQAARVLHLHPNTVRYRLQRIVEVCGYDPRVPRDADVLRTALAMGRRTTST